MREPLVLRRRRILMIVMAGAILLTGVCGPALAQDYPAGDSMDMTPDGAGRAPTDEADDDTSTPTVQDGILTPPSDEETGESEDEEPAENAGDSPPTRDCGVVDPPCWLENTLISIVWWIVRAPALILQSLVDNMAEMGFALPDPSGPLAEKYDQVARAIRPLVLVGMLLLGALMMVRSANYNTAYLLQSGLPRIGLAVLGLTFFPTVAGLMADISNGVATSFYKDAEVTRMFVELIKEAFLGAVLRMLPVLFAPPSWGPAMIIAVIFLAPVVVMVLLLFILTYLNAMFFSLLVLVGPIALACYAVPGLQPVTEAWFKGVLATAVLPIVFSIEIMLMSWAASNPESIGPAGGSAAIIVCVLLLWMMVKTPGKVYHWAFSSFGGGSGGGFLAGMGVRSLLKTSLKMAAGVVTGGAAGGAGAASAGALGAGTAKGSVKHAARNLARADHPSTLLTGGWKQHAAKQGYQRALDSLQGTPGALRAIRQSGEASLGASNRIDELSSQVLGGKLSADEVAERGKAIQEQLGENKEILASNLAGAGGQSPEDYKNLIEAEERSQRSGQGSQVGALEFPQAPPSAAPDEDLGKYASNTANETRQPADEDALQAYTAAVAAPQSIPSPGDSPASSRISGQDAPADQERAPGPLAQDPPNGARRAASAPGETGFTPRRFTQAPMSDEQKQKAQRVNDFLKTNADAGRAFARAAAEDRRMRDSQGSYHHQAMRGNLHMHQATELVQQQQARRGTNLEAAAKDIHTRFHGPGGQVVGGAPITQRDVQEILGARLDQAYDAPFISASGAEVGWSRKYFEDKIPDQVSHQAVTDIGADPARKQPASPSIAPEDSTPRYSPPGKNQMNIGENRYNLPDE